MTAHVSPFFLPFILLSRIENARLHGLSNMRILKLKCPGDESRKEIAADTETDSNVNSTHTFRLTHAANSVEPFPTEKS